MVTHGLSSMFRTERQFMSYVEHGHTALSVVGELGGAVVEQLLVYVVHDVWRSTVKDKTFKSSLAGFCIEK